MSSELKSYEDENMILFSGKENIYSQFYKCNFTIGTDTFNCCEQWMMYSKAIFFLDEETEDKILKSSDPKEIKKLGRQVKNFDDDKWDLIKEKVIFKGNIEKFSQNEELKEKLLNSGNKLIVEASSWDSIYGSGFNVETTKEKILNNEDIEVHELSIIVT
jgi:ribA/ribD-fused uncharacterized protein